MFVDIQQDSNEPGYQECAAAADDCSLRRAITRANLDAGNNYIIQVPAGIYRLTLEGVLEDQNATGDLDISGKVTLVGDGADNTWIDANQIDRVLHIRSGARVELRAITILGGKGATGIVAGGAGEYGGGILNQGDLVIRDSIVRYNQAGDGAPGALEIDGGDGGSGGGIYNLSVLKIIESTIRENRASNGGNGWNVCRSENMFCWVCEQCTYPGDGGNGGGIFNEGVLNLESSAIVSNSIGQPGEPTYCSFLYIGSPCPYYVEWLSGISGMGGGMVNEGRVEAESSTIIDNEGGAGAGGIENYGAAFLTGCTISGNRGDSGGGISNLLEAMLAGCSVDGNSGGNGGGIYNRSDLLVKETWIRDNDGAMGGGIYNDGTAIVEDTKIAQNHTREGKAGEYYAGKVCSVSSGGTSPGGGVYNAGDMVIDYSQISSNITGNGGSGVREEECFGPSYGGAGGYGGGIYNTGVLELNLCTVEGNQTGDGGLDVYDDGQDGPGGSGGGIYNVGAARINLSTFASNQTGEGESGGKGGGIANEGQMTIIGGSVRGNLTIQDGNGGGIYASSPITISAATVISNTAAGNGGGLSFEGTTGEVVNSILIHNQSGSYGSGLYTSGSLFGLENNTFAQNYGGDGSGMHAISSTLSLTNTLLVSHTLGLVVDENSLVDMESTLWGSGIWANQLDWADGGTIITGTNNYWEDPGFLNPAGLDYHILATSPAIDRGVNNVSDMDIDFQPRPNPVLQFVDLGADEYWTAIPIETVSITGQPTVTRQMPITLTATISPDSATPNILYYWRPPPVEGQWTENAVYAWERSGTEKVTLMAINAASTVSDTLTIIVEPVYSWIYLPAIGR